ncbi:radical SAM/SPASM domain-containing protein [Flavobacterium hungaricum]|uniref:SPASM domain-containing protein n=1 Tax=Flavobacterium hungaricum TaxID=2082725 RepID=A0ABR9TGT2_9FLAO|nr:radical SAM protein [Flavobacterium hungaricum]MBE8724571.1 SPASM domain-containing protein [Flavobacterium hungaricum]
MKFSKYHLSTDELSEVDMPNKRIIFSTRTATSILIEENIYQFAINNEFDKVDNEIYKTLVEKEFIVNTEEDEYQYIMSKNAEVRDTVNFLAMTIQPSANCQLGCHYCGQTHTKDYAKEDVIDKYLERIEFLLNGKDIYNGLAITWYGGEPLTGYSSIKKASKRMIALCKEKGFTYISDMITNGLSLKPKLFEELVKECGITDYQITIDGTAESHDTRRITKAGDPTFDIIMKNIADVTQTATYKDYGCNISIRVNIDKTNYQYVEPLIDYIKEMNLQDKVSMYFATIVDFGGNDAGKESLTKDFFAQKEIEWLFRCYEHNIRVNILPKRSYSVCMVEQKDSEVWDAFGNIYACWEFPYSETYGKGDSLIGNLFESKETYNMNATLRDWSTVVDSGTTWCKSCLHLPVCGGGCPKSWHEGTPACPPFKSNFKDKLLLDYYIRQKKEEIAKN